MSDTPEVNECPKCKAPFWYFTSVNTRVYECGSESFGIQSKSCKYATRFKEELNAANAKIRELEAVVNDPEALWSNWLRGTVKLPAGIGDVRKHQEHIAELENRLRAKFNKSEEDSKHYQERIQRLVEAGDNVAKIIGPPGSNFWAEVPEIDRAYLAWTKAKEGL